MECKFLREPTRFHCDAEKVPEIPPKQSFDARFFRIAVSVFAASSQNRDVKTVSIPSKAAPSMTQADHLAPTARDLSASS
jgi:hypothetical protein